MFNGTFTIPRVLLSNHGFTFIFSFCLKSKVENFPKCGLHMLVRLFFLHYSVRFTEITPVSLRIFFTFYHCFLGLCLILISINEMLFPIKNITLNFSYSSPLVFFSYFILLFMLENPNLASEASMWSPDLQLQLKSSICRTFTFLFEFLTRLNKLIFQALLYQMLPINSPPSAVIYPCHLPLVSVQLS